MATRDPPKKRKERKLKVPDHTISDISAYMAQIAEKLNESAGQVSGSADATSQSGSSYSGSSYSDSYGGGPGIGNVIPGSPGSPKVRMVEEFMRHTDESGDWLQKWYSENYEKVENYEYIRFELLYFLCDYMPGIKVDENIDARNLVELVKSLVLDLHTKFNRFNLELQDISGHEVAGYIQDHHRKVIEVVEDYENKLKAANEEVVLCKDQITHLGAELSAALQRMMYLEKGTAYFGGFEDSVSEEQFMADLQRRVAQSNSLNSSMKEELQKERAENEGLQKQLALLAKEKVETQEKCMQEIVELSKRAEINSMLEQGIKSMLEKGSKEPNKQDCQNVINKWKNEINQVIDQNSKEIDELLKKVESQNKEMAMLQAQAREQDERIEEMQTQVKNSRTLLDNYKTEAAELRNHIDEFKKVLEDLHNESFGLQEYMARAPRASGSQDEYNIDDHIIGPVGGEIPEYDLLSETLPLRYPRRRRRPMSPVSELISDESSVEVGPLPMGGMGVIRLDDSDVWHAVGGGSPTQQDRGASPRAQLRFVDGQWIEVGESAPLAAQQFEPQREADLMGAVRLDRAGWEPIGGRVSPVAQQESPREPFQPTGPMRFIDGQWVPITSPGRLSPPRLHSTLRPISPRRSRIPVSLGMSSRGLDVSSIRAPSPIRMDAPMRLTTPRAGTAHRLGAPSMGLARTITPPRIIVSGPQPTAMRRGTPPRPRIPTLQPMVQRSRIPQRTGIPVAMRGGIPQRMGVSSMRSAATTPSPAGGLMSRVMILSPRLESIPLDMDVAPQDIYPLPGEVEFLSEVGGRIQPLIPESEIQNIRRERRIRRPRPQFTPRTGFQR